YSISTRTLRQVVVLMDHAADRQRNQVNCHRTSSYERVSQALARTIAVERRSNHLLVGSWLKNSHSANDRFDLRRQAMAANSSSPTRRSVLAGSSAVSAAAVTAALNRTTSDTGELTRDDIHRSAHFQFHPSHLSDFLEISRVNWTARCRGA